ncbi:actin-like protein [Trypanosoma grayi]|uniref:actin-like protein n=1 Tax=Trypanosoma grayi TaxID=71804 RepID=UPI0004F42BD9|nr:actin-like protein [Trypanosoma grayi]KEG13747.1 actin-like protein [Trypanosoma grayi]
MDTTFVVDYGSHTVKHTCFSKSDKSSAFDVSPNEVPSRAYVDDTLDVALLGKHLAELLSDACPEDSGLTLALLVDALLPQWKRELVLKCCIEHLDAKQVFLGNVAATALFSVAETTGIGVDIGYRGVRIVPVVNGVARTSLCADVPLVGARQTDNVLRRHIPQAEEALLQMLKATACFIGDEAPALPQQLMLPDGSSLPFPLSTSTCREAGEALLFHAPHIRAPDVLQHTYQKCLLELPSLKHWVLFGGASSITGTREALRGAMNRVVAPLQGATPPQLLHVKSPMQAALSGGVIVSQLSSFKSMCVSAAEYAEEGPHRCIHLKTVDER